MKTPRGTAIALLLFTSATVHADILRWDTNAVIPGTQSINLAPGVDLSDWNTGQHKLEFALFNADLSSASFQNSDLRNAKFTGATLTNASFANATLTGDTFDGDINFTLAQLYSSGSYVKRNLRGIHLIDLELSGANLAKQNLSNATFQSADLSGADFTKANLANATFSGDLSNITLVDAKLTRATFSGANLTNANFSGATLQKTTFSNVVGFTSAELDSTASYAHRNLKGIQFDGDDLTSWNFSRQNLANATFTSDDLTNANFTNAKIAGADFDDVNLTTAQLYTTANYAKHNLSNITLSNVDLSGANLVKQNLAKASFAASDLSNGTFTKATLNKTNFTDTDLADASFTGAKFANANFSDADLRGATGFVPVRTTLATNTILPDGTIHGLFLGANEKLTIHNNSIPVMVETNAAFNPASTLQFILFAGWSSPIGFAAGITPTLAGTLDLELPTDIDPSAYYGDSFQLFDWNSPPASGNQFSVLLTDPRFNFDVSDLYTTGIVTLSAAGNSPPVTTPEPASLTLLMIGSVLLVKTRRAPSAS